MKAYRESLLELRREAAFQKAARAVPGLEQDLKVLLSFFRKDTLAHVRLYRMKVIGLGLEGRWVLQDLTRHPDGKIQRAATAVLRAYDGLRHRTGTEK